MYVLRREHRTAEEGKVKMRLKRIISRLIEWLKTHGVSADDIVDCIGYITK